VHAGRFATLTAHETTLFNALAAASGRTVTKAALMAALYPVEADEADIKIVDVFVCKLRAKLKPLGLDIQTIWGRGYRFVAPAGGAS
jgi:two-component system, cell cycle response regulator CtrA